MAKCELCIEGGMIEKQLIAEATHKVTIEEHSSAVFFGVAGKKSVKVCDECLNAGAWEHEGIDDETGDFKMYDDIVEKLG